MRVWVLEDRRVGDRQLAQRLRDQGFDVEVTAHGPDEFLSEVHRHLPQVALIDVSHPRADRVAVIEALARDCPGVRTLATAERPSRPLELKCRGAGAWRCVDKGQALTRAVLAAGASAGPPPSRLIDLSCLTAREREVIGLVGEGLDNLKIGALLGITERTVKAHVSAIYRKIGAQSRVELALAARAYA